MQYFLQINLYEILHVKFCKTNTFRLFHNGFKRWICGQIKAAEKNITTTKNGDENSKKQASEQEILKTI